MLRQHHLRKDGPNSPKAAIISLSPAQITPGEVQIQGIVSRFKPQVLAYGPDHVVNTENKKLLQLPNANR